MSVSPFDERVASVYEGWFQTPAGRRADLAEKKLLEEYLRPFLPATMLELGCGTGHFTRWFAELGFDVTGSDISAPMLEVAARLSPGITWLRADAHQLPFKDRCFDLGVAITALEFVADPAGVLSEMMRVCSKALLLGVLNRWSLLSFSRRFKSLVGGESIYSKARFFSVRGLKRMITKVAEDRGLSVDCSHRLTLYPKLLPVFSSGQPLGGFVVMLAKLQA